MTLALPDNSASRSGPGLMGRFLDSIKINAVDHQRRADRPMVVKRRSWASRRIAGLSNFYFWMAGIPIRFCTKPAEWQRREVASFRTLNRGFAAYAEGRAAVAAEKLPGRNLFEHLKDRTLTRRMVIAAGKEFRRAHNVSISGGGGVFEAWTHGDATMSNVIYDPATDCARLIDFELRHVEALPLNRRRADDLLVFLLDLVGYASHRRWVPLARAFLAAYDNGEVVAELIPMLRSPRGLGRIWFSVRTNFVEPVRVGYRLKQLRRALEGGGRFGAS